MYDRQWLQSGLGHDRSLHEICRDRAMHNCLSRRDVRSLNQYVNSETWLSVDVSIGQRNNFCNRTYWRAHETLSGAQAHSTTYHPQTNGFLERQNWILASMLRVNCSRDMTDWDRYLPQVMGAYNSTQHFTSGVSPHLMLTGN